MRAFSTFVAASTLVLFALAEVLLALPIGWWLYLSLVGLFAIALLRLKPISAQIRQVLVFAVVTTLIAALYIVPWSSRKPFLKALYSIQPGLTEAEARQIMKGYMEGTGWPAVYGGSPAGTGTLNDLGTGAKH